MCYLCSENKGAISFAVTAKLICAFVFAYAKRWFSHDAAQIQMLRDINFCLTYIPPQKSKLYSNIALLENFDFFDYFSDEIRHYAYLGDVYICGDLNSRTGSLPDFVEEIGLDRFVDLPDSDEQSTSISIRQSFDSIVNAFGHTLISLCKENDLEILNGRLEPGRFTFMSHTGSSVVDYFITQTSNYSKILNISINDPTEFSDHCVMEIIFAFKFQIKGENPKTFDKLTWDSSRCEELLHKLEDKRYRFEEISN